MTGRVRGPLQSIPVVVQCSSMATPSLVIQHYGSKIDLFAIAARLDRKTTDEDVSEHLFDVLDVRLGELPPETRALVRSMLTAPEATAAMKDFLDERITNLARVTTGDDAELRAALTVSSILGLTIARHFLKLDALTEISEEQIATTLRPWPTAGLGNKDASLSSPGRSEREQPRTA